MLVCCDHVKGRRLKFIAHTVSNQIVKSLSLRYKKSCMVQPVDLFFCRIIEIIEQNFFNGADFLSRS